MSELWDKYLAETRNQCERTDPSKSLLTELRPSTRIRHPVCLHLYADNLQALLVIATAEILLCTRSHPDPYALHKSCCYGIDALEGLNSNDGKHISCKNEGPDGGGRRWER
jgi:hypothetical protein